MVTTMARQLMEVHGKVEMTPTGLFAAVAGEAAPGAAGRRIAAAAIRATAATASAFAL